MKRLFFLGIFLASILPVFALSQPTFAIDVLGNVCNGTSAPSVCKDDTAGSKTNPIFGPGSILSEVIGILSLIVGIAAVIGIIVSGLMMITANGDAGSISNARRSILYCLVGLVIAAIAQILVAFVLNKL